ncbi:putative membrane protein involved in D-alanine export [Owenweeksia hongkongensis DSM 17368]|uniref:Putative membrane protein involved in D-alanine export n=1 Tax=Owenweeksia hongkongensis (strain DSM 17368 / CIP 108786 / JCM 12287 / NRRL B-23963 / UST20020801) TaxID=926562 RepID=G8R0L1_OWEHD|nr:MBOAT family O-acyltransferase [Owenweeksia hongkongensis]AEV32715.1 putative membrane protein involved in D-alanine export [Owenweeksia hongkongensis DSM 17368]
MKFNSVEFFVFLAIVFGLLWRFSKSLRWNNILLLVASYVFYGWWDYRFLFLMFASSLVDYLVGYFLPGSNRKKLLMGISLGVNLGLLMFFKYFNFFINSAEDLMHGLGYDSHFQVLNIILPVGISFYTFQTLSYSLDVYKGKLKPQKNFIAFLNYVSFFPQLVAGPIERAAVFLPQFLKPRVFDYNQAVLGMRLLLYGIFKKMVIADNVGLRVDEIFSNPSDRSGAELIFGISLFFVQLYSDFSAYTDIARGVAKMLGFELMRNFRTPLFAKSIPEFWARWHISLTTWFRDYLFLWLAGLNRKSTLWRIVATVILFFVIGFWHGANYTFAVFGILNGLYFIPRILSRKSRGMRDVLSILNNHPFWSSVSRLFTFSLICFTGVLFRSENIEHAWSYYEGMFTNNFLGINEFTYQGIAIATGFMVFEWFTRHKPHPFDLEDYPTWLRRTLYVLLILAVFLFGYFGKEPFYYFQF